MGLAEFTDSKVRDPKIVELMKPITASVDPELSESLPLDLCDKTAIIRVKMKDGREIERKGYIPHLNWEGIKTKYRESAGSVPSERGVKESTEVVEDLENVKNLNRLTKLISG